MEYEDVVRAECSFVDESDMREDLRRDNRVECSLKTEENPREGNQVFVDRWSFHGASMAASSAPHEDFDFVVTFPGDCEKNLLSGGSSLTCQR